MDLLEKISGLSWNLRKEEYKNIFSDKEWLLDHPTQNAIKFSDNIDNRRVSVHAYFLTDSQDALGKIAVSFEDIETDTQRKYIFENLIRFLTEKYGNPKYSSTMLRLSTPPEYRISESMRWATEDTIVEAILALSEHGAVHPALIVFFYSKQNDPLMKQFPDYVNKNNVDNETFSYFSFKSEIGEQINKTSDNQDDYYKESSFEQLWSLIKLSNSKILEIDWEEKNLEKIKKQLVDLGFNFKNSNSQNLIGFSLKFDSGDIIDGGVAFAMNRTHYSFHFVFKKADNLINWLEKKYGESLRLREELSKEYRYDWTDGDILIEAEMAKMTNYVSIAFQKWPEYTKLVRGEMKADEFFKKS
ncbi:MAG: hypothetical protein PHX90_04490 [Thermotogota bacterium]|nr:hypothetical protein [Thermotogota bacterium]